MKKKSYMSWTCLAAWSMERAINYGRGLYVAYSSAARVWGQAWGVGFSVLWQQAPTKSRY